MFALLVFIASPWLVHSIKEIIDINNPGDVCEGNDYCYSVFQDPNMLDWNQVHHHYYPTHMTPSASWSIAFAESASYVKLMLEYFSGPNYAAQINPYSVQEAVLNSNSQVTCDPLSGIDNSNWHLEMYGLEDSFLYDDADWPYTNGADNCDLENFPADRTGWKKYYHGPSFSVDLPNVNINFALDQFKYFGLGVASVKAEFALCCTEASYAYGIYAAHPGYAPHNTTFTHEAVTVWGYYWSPSDGSSYYGVRFSGAGYRGNEYMWISPEHLVSTEVRFLGWVATTPYPLA